MDRGMNSRQGLAPNLAGSRPAGCTLVDVTGARARVASARWPTKVSAAMTVASSARDATLRSRRLLHAKEEPLPLREPLPAQIGGADGHTKTHRECE